MSKKKSKPKRRYLVWRVHMGTSQQLQELSHEYGELSNTRASAWPERCSAATDRYLISDQEVVSTGSNRRIVPDTS